MLIGHFALPVVIRHFRPDFAPLPLYSSSVFPDVTDKALKWLGLRQNGRTFSHSLLGMGATTALVYAIWGKRHGRSWLLGYVSHLICDLGGTVPWFYPFRAYRFRLSPHSYTQKARRVFTHPHPLETILVIWAAVILVRRLQRGYHHSISRPSR